MMKKILYVHYGDAWMRGSEVCLLNLMNSLDKRHYCPILWTNNPKLHHAAEESGIVSQLSEFGVLLGWRGQRASLSQYLGQIEQAETLIKQHQIDLVHVNSGAPCQWMWRAARDCKVPMLTQLHSGYTLRDRLRLCLHLSPYLVTVSHAISQPLLREGFPAERLKVVHNGIDLEALEAQPTRMVRSTLGLPMNSTVMASVGSLIHRKGMDRIIRALATLRTEHPDLHLLIIGDGPALPTLRKLATQLDVEEKIHFVGEQHHVCGWLRGGVDLFVSGAREEAFGLVLAEAAAAGVPVIAPRVGGIPEVLQHGKSALLYDSEQPEQMAEHIECLLTSPSLAKTLAANAHTRVYEQFSLQTNTSNLTNLYQQLLSQYARTCSPPRLMSSLKPLKALSCSHILP